MHPLCFKLGGIRISVLRLHLDGQGECTSSG